MVGKVVPSGRSQLGKPCDYRLKVLVEISYSLIVCLPVRSPVEQPLFHAASEKSPPHHLVVFALQLWPSKSRIHPLKKITEVPGNTPEVGHKPGCRTPLHVAEAGTNPGCRPKSPASARVSLMLEPSWSDSAEASRFRFLWSWPCAALEC